ncbi:MAG: aminoacyl-tRNA hydrolase [Cyclobacteriaceae bacterium]|nr:aminoacyl-tRNA hydrolase [Cyclobacteriaceae bacterium]
MSLARPSIEEILHELEFTTSRSSGPGGQNVNKVNTKVTLKWDVPQSAITEAQKEVILSKLHARLTKENVLVLTSQDERSQLGNKEAVIIKLEQLLIKAFAIKKARKATKPGKAAKQTRLKNKKQHAEKKKWRQKPE